MQGWFQIIIGDVTERHHYEDTDMGWHVLYDYRKWAIEGENVTIIDADEGREQFCNRLILTLKIECVEILNEMKPLVKKYFPKGWQNFDFTKFDEHNCDTQPMDHD